MSVNAGSCVKLAHYLDKESGSGKFFFSQNQDSVPLTEVIQKIDNNKKTLKNNQDKFYMLSVTILFSALTRMFPKPTFAP